MTEPVDRRGSWLVTRWDRLNGARRIGGIDLARGLAVLGMFAAHLVAIPELVYADPSTWSGIVHGRSSILFATLAGVSIGLLTGGTTPVVGDALRTARRRLLVRAAFLWLLGVLLIATEVPVYVILPAYALLFLLAIPLVPLPAGVLLPLAAILALVMPFVQVLLDALPLWDGESGYELDLVLGWHYPFTTWIAFVVAGMGVARLGLRRISVQAGMLAAGAALALAAYGLDAVSGGDEAFEQVSFWAALWTARAHSSGLLEIVGSGGFALAAIGASLLLCRTPGRWIALPLRAVGAMPLSAYTAQIVAWAIISVAVLGDASDLVGFRGLAPFWPFVAWTIVGCTAWALLVGRGPLEWLIDRAARLVGRRRREPSA